MITFITHLRVSPYNAAAFEALLTEVSAKTRENEPDVLYYAFARSAQDPNTYVVIEVYRDEAAHSAHMGTDWVKSSIPKSTLLIENGKYDIRQYVSRFSEWPIFASVIACPTSFDRVHPVSSTPYPCTSSHPFSIAACVDRPVPSVPSITSNFPLHESTGR